METALEILPIPHPTHDGEADIEMEYLECPTWGCYENAVATLRTLGVGYSEQRIEARGLFAVLRIGNTLMLSDFNQTLAQLSA